MKNFTCVNINRRYSIAAYSFYTADYFNETTMYIYGTKFREKTLCKHYIEMQKSEFLLKSSYILTSQ